MKKNIMIYLLMALVCFGLQSCLFQEEDYFDDSSANRATEEVKQYSELLESASNGWRMEYYIGQDYALGGITLLCKFDGQRVTMASQGYEGDETISSLYKVVSEEATMLTFDTYNAFIHAYAKPQGGGSNPNANLQGDYEFIIKEASAEKIVMQGKKYGNTIVMYALPDDLNWEAYINSVNDVEENAFFIQYQLLVDGNIKCENINGRLTFTHVNYEPILAVPYDTPIVGYENNVVNNLRLWSAEPVDNEFDFCYFNRGQYLKAIEYRNSIEAISQVLYPDDSMYEGKLLRLKQQYFFVSAGLQSIVRHYKKNGGKIEEFDEYIAIHINDTHPTLAIPELMRILLDEEGLSWESAMRITTNTVSYTNHTILSEALEKWPINMFKELLPRIYMIVEEMNERYCAELWHKYIGQWDKISKMAIIGDGFVRMANLAIVGSHSVNGVAKLHTEILKKKEMSDFYYLYPSKFNNKTNGIAHRRWLLKSNPELTNLLKETIGDSFIKHPTDMENFEKYIDDEYVLKRLGEIKRKNKENLAKVILDNQGIKVDPNSIFDVQVKRIHAYKRQTLNCLRIMELYNRLLENPNLDIAPRTFIFAGKAAPAYYLAKNTIELINAVAKKVNNDKRINDKIKVVFLENYRVSLAERIIPATDLSEQISTTTKEASGTSNMKFMMNGAVTIATLDGANIEIRDEVGDDNIVIFGLTENEVLYYYSRGGYSAWDVRNNDNRLIRVTDDLINGVYSKDRDKFRSVYDNLLTYNDEFFVLKDFDSYLKAQDKVDLLYRNNKEWQRKCGVNIAHSGIFSSDRTITEYATGIWGSKVIYKNL